MTKKKLFWIGLIWIILFLFIFNNMQDWAVSWCKTGNNYSCWNNFETLVSVLWLAPSIFILTCAKSTRRNVFFVGVVAMILVIGLSFTQEHYGSICDYSVNGGYSTHYCENTISALLPILLLIPLSVVLLLFREEVFRTWLHFTYFWIPISIFFVYLAAGSSGGGFGIPNVFDQEFVAIIFSVLFVIISLLIIIYNIIKFRYQDKNKSFKDFSKSLIIAFSLLVFMLLFWFFHGLFFRF